MYDHGVKVLVCLADLNNCASTIDTIKSMPWAPATQIRLFLVLTIESGLPLGSLLMGPGKQHHGLEISQKERQLRFLAGQLQQALPHCAVDIEVWHGDAKAAIIEAAGEWPANLIVLTKRPRKKLERLIMGDCCKNVATHAHCPVLILKPLEHELPGVESHGFQNILVAVDQSIYSRATLYWLCNMEWSARTRIKLIMAVEDVGELHPDDITPAIHGMSPQMELNVAARLEIEELSKPLIGRFGAHAITTQIADGDAKEIIMDTAVAWGADLVVVGSHGRTSLSKLVLGSVSENIAAQAPCAVAILRELISDEYLEKLKPQVIMSTEEEEPIHFERGGYGDDRPHITPTGM
ncbi:MAG: universal stress protein [Candidatus Obscuribacter sp.]|jgi:nucleotide-binding universal stress UspA family protein|nr:universal stress protein [Candidatus Obscuribacter sp.]MDQ5967580.1 Universal stress protein [Cyanobacteriota bacterium erpe_2018_sw_39hr_WHONDRS-SW48-000098_B_bin.30]MBL0189189.1 universal stress protein [Candidatus Obscuribacter sp.]MBP6348363.1 universal stress protein [Candidatus Obscuribacter sp.]MBP6593351.1 universal stress protein [Candidatus Obscuribacter sp.]